MALLNPYHDLIANWFNDVPSLKSVQVWKRLGERGIKVAENTVSNFTKKFRRKKLKTYWPLTFLPGEEAQVDWFFMNHVTLGKLAGFIIILSYSRFAFAHFFCRSGFEFFVQGHLMAFPKFGGVPLALRYDNLKTVVLKRQPLIYNPSFLEFARHYDFDIRLCNPAAGNEKGRVERLIRAIRDTFENTAGQHQSLIALNQGLHEWIDDKNATAHRATNQKPQDKLKEETLKKLPANPYPNVAIYPPRKTTKTGLVIFDTNSYSVPSYLTGQRVSFHVGVSSLEFYDSKEKKVASHPRVFAKHQTIINPLHRSVAKLSASAKRQRIHAIMKSLDGDMAVFLDQNAGVGEDAFTTAHALFKLMKTTSRSMLLSIIREAIKRKSPRLKFIISSLEHTNQEIIEAVMPQKQELLIIDYTPRPLDTYEQNNKQTTASPTNMQPE